MAETEEEVAFDERFEFDAPQFYDFDEGSPPEKAPADGWFDTEGPRGEDGAFLEFAGVQSGERRVAGPQMPAWTAGNNAGRCTPTPSVALVLCFCRPGHSTKATAGTAGAQTSCRCSSWGARECESTSD